MNKKTNTVLFILVGTVCNVFVTLVCFFGILVLYSSFLHPTFFKARFSETSVTWALPVIFICSIFVSFMVYRLAIKLLLKKIDMDKHFIPIFGKRQPTNKLEVKSDT